MLFFAHYGANQMLGQLYKKVELDLDKIVHKSKYLKKLKLFFDNWLFPTNMELDAS